MTLIEDATETRRGPQHRWPVAMAAFGIPVALLFSQAMVLITALTDQVLVSSRAELSSVTFGWPLGWVEQDRRYYDDPPFPSHLGLSSPWENPTSVSPGAFLVDLLLVFALVSAVVLAAALMAAFAQRRLGIRRTA